ncbi:Adenylate cyclase [Thioalkalivibrio nitratireducens DSM 14787]|uniref:Adenylate cyclase n=1 Tax=Thioalkalivibrio nitratireducens (strain DSM 14787 / UNIQEM 213 / ALEN2) TaxID=1255043 RepID=L0DUE5_THIND|nr:adenylate/guanylate cyclase domain-containing protein [Thioalkalivibrio nitratireducens]AGA31961.1 Adenylate cyclase [Thioalkalivibrio nitratireducens DSM 14787]
MALAPVLPRYLPIAWKLAAVISALTLLTVVALATLVLYQVRDVLHNQIRVQAELIVGHIARASAEPILADDRLAVQTLVQAQLQDGDIEFLAVHANDRGLLASAGQRPGTQPLDAHPHWSLVPSSHYQYRPVLFQGVEVGWVEAYIDTAPMQGLLQNTIRAGVATAVVISILGLLLAITISKRMVRPLERLARATREHAAVAPSPSLVQDELGQLIHAFQSMSTDLLRKDQVEDALRRYVSDGVAQDILDNLDRVELGGRPVEGSVLFADIKGYTTLSEGLDPAELGRILNEFFGPMASTIAAHGGVVDKYIGDCTMAVFGVTRPDADHRLKALCAGLALLDTIREINRKREQRGEVRTEFRIGLHAGRMLAGNLGAEDRMQYTVVGDPVNLASRLTEIAKPDSLLVTDGFMDRDELARRFRIRSCGRRQLRGVADEVELLCVLEER